MKKFIQKLSITLAAALLLLTYSCKKWDNFYATPAYLDNGSILNIINKNPGYKEFAGLIKKAGYDSVLRRTDLYTVLAIKNGAFTGIDTNNIPLVKSIIGVHILPGAIYTQNMNNTMYVAITGKSVNFNVVTSGQTANGIKIAAIADKTINGIIYEIAQPIIPQPNIYDVIAGNTGFSIFSSYINSSVVLTIDRLLNPLIGYDIFGNPVYKTPYIYIRTNTYLDDSKINDEKTITTAFIPDNSLVNTVLSKMLAGRAGKADMIIPKIGVGHNDTTIGGNYFIPKGVAYAGDSAILKNYLFRHVIVRGNIPSVTASSTFTDILGTPLTIAPGQITGNATAVSNGTYYTLNDVTLPESAYRNSYYFAPAANNAAGTAIKNPNIVYTGGAAYGSEVSTNVSNLLGTRYRLFATRFNFNRVGAKIDFKLPFVARGYYKVILKNYLDNNGAIVNASYGSQLLKQNINTSTLNVQNEGVIDVDLGTINVTSNGLVQLTFTCADVSPKTAAQYLFTVDTVILVPVTP